METYDKGGVLGCYKSIAYDVSKKRPKYFMDSLF
jgi:hypothetical protein